jgi:hypothetical protein
VRRWLLSILAATFLPGVESWLLSRRDEFAQAHIALERVRQAMRRDRRASARAHSYEAGDLVKVSTRVLPLRASSAQSPNLGVPSSFLCGHSKWLNM